MVTTMRESCRREARRATVPEGRRCPPNAPRDEEPRAAERTPIVTKDKARGCPAKERGKKTDSVRRVSRRVVGVVGGGRASLPRRRSSEQFSVPDRPVSCKVEKEGLVWRAGETERDDRGGGLEREREARKREQLVERRVLACLCRVRRLERSHYDRATR